MAGGGDPAAASGDSHYTPTPRKLLSLHWPVQEESGERAGCGSGNIPRMRGRGGKEASSTPSEGRSDGNILVGDLTWLLGRTGLGGFNDEEK